jgi:ElaB/YqjD/DUF883 family membrane-anchored ribosome-binding protein
MEEKMNESIKDFKDQVTHKVPLAVDHSIKEARSLFESIERPIEETYGKLKKTTVEAYDSSIHTVRENPVKSLAIALGVGVAAGYLLKRRYP